ncbi:MAG: beta-lactamase family protein, partial [Deltaproteobacteria bacterium]|nr:beta-lactamase family protein [Deltaproteobacteria bacterium]
MKRFPKVLLILFLVISFFISCSTLGSVDTKGTKIDGKQFLGKGKYLGKYWPTDNWRTCAPEEVGIDSEKLANAIAYAANPEFKTEGIVIVKNGYIVGEAYLNYFEKDEVHTSYSMAKSFTSALIGIAIDKGLIAGIDEKICRHDEYWDCADKEDLRSKITIRNALTLTTGLKWHEDWSKWDPSTNDALKMGANGRFAKYMSDRRGLHEPGQVFYYSTGDPMLLSRVIQKATGKTAFEFAKQNLFRPLNITNVSWVNDLDGYTSTAWGLETTVRDYAKFGYLFLNKGYWEDRRVVSGEWVEKSTKTDPSVKMWSAYGYLWHVNLPLRLSFSRSPVSTDAIPPDGYMAEGVRGQNIF